MPAYDCLSTGVTMSLLDPISRVFGNGNNRGVAVARCDNGHNQGIRDPQKIGAVSSQLRADYGKQICLGTHPGTGLLRHALMRAVEGANLVGAKT
jgi:hypothetical protein